MARKKVRARDLKKQRWAAIVAAVLALGMILGLFGPNVYHAIFGSGTPLPDQQSEPEPQDYLDYYEAEVARLESQLDENEENEAVLLELAENYRYLIVVQQVFFNNEEAIEEYQERLIDIYTSLTDVAPADMQYRLELAYLLFEGRDDHSQMLDEASAISDILRANPDPLYHLSLIQLFDLAGEDELLMDEAKWLEEYLEEKIADDTADNDDRFYYAVLLGEYLGNVTFAKAILEEVIEEESEESRLYQNALSYLQFFQAESNEEQGITVD